MAYPYPTNTQRSAGHSNASVRRGTLRPASTRRPLPRVSSPPPSSTSSERAALKAASQLVRTGLGRTPYQLAMKLALMALEELLSPDQSGAEREATLEEMLALGLRPNNPDGYTFLSRDPVNYGYPAGAGWISGIWPGWSWTGVQSGPRPYYISFGPKGTGLYNGAVRKVHTYVRTQAGNLPLTWPGNQYPNVSTLAPTPRPTRREGYRILPRTQPGTLPFPVLPVLPWIDPNAIPIGQPAPLPWTIPYRYIPARPVASPPTTPDGRERPVQAPTRGYGRPRTDPSSSGRRGVRSAPKTNGRASARTRPYIRRPPTSSRDKEKKFIMSGNPNSALLKWAGRFTEGLDIIACVYKGVPKHAKPKFADPIRRAGIIWDNLDEINWGKVFFACLQDQIEDMVYAKASKTAGKAARKFHEYSGISVNGLGAISARISSLSKPGFK